MVPVIRNADTLPLEALGPSCAALPKESLRRHAQCRQLPARHLHGEQLGMTASIASRRSSIRRRWRSRVTRVIERRVVRDGAIVAAPMMGCI